MSKIEVNEIVPQSGTTLTLGGSGDTLSIASGVTSSFPSLTVSGDLTVDTNTLKIDSTNNRVGIGTTSPGNTLDVRGSIFAYDGGTQGTLLSNTGSIEIARTAGDPFIDFKTTTAVDYDVRIQQLGNGLRFITGGSGSTSEAMRIDSSGNVLVGMTSVSGTTDGLHFRPGIASGINVTNDHTIALNRKSSDGEILRFLKDSSLVGSIGTKSGELVIGSGDTGVSFVPGSDALVPKNTTTNVNANNLISLGIGSARWKDLYLGGSVYLGGITSANALDDYEEGTYSGEFRDSNGVVPSQTAVGHYVKIGNHVTVHGQVTLSGSTSGTGITFISLPFTVKSNARGGMGIGLVTGGIISMSSNNKTLHLIPEINTTPMYFVETDYTGTHTHLTFNSNFGSSGIFSYSGSYITN